MIIYPAILTGSKQDAQEQVIWASGFDEVRTVHIDIIDGQFVNNVTLTPADLPEIDFGEMSADLHLMTEEPLDFVYEAIEHRQRIPIRTMIGQVERMSYQEHFIQTVKKHTWQVGLALDLFTPLEEIEPESWQQLDVLLIMGVEVGLQGQEFHAGVLGKIQQALEIRRRYGRDFEIMIDGGVNPQIARGLQDLENVNVVVGSNLWQSKDLHTAFKELQGEE